MKISPVRLYKRLMFFGILSISILFVALSCISEKDGKKTFLFQHLPSQYTNITFMNSLTESDTFNYFLYSYIYMGGGVSVGDFNNDGLTDIYFTANMESNRLYLNNGNLTFEDVTEISNTGGDERWMLGSTICDINNDGLTDIYVSVSGLLGNRENLLYVNRGVNKDGIPVFTEEAGRYGIADPGLSTQSTFLDYDNDGDLDLYVANYPITHFKSPPFFYRQMMRNVRWADSDHLYRNNSDGTFTDVTVESGLLSFGLTLSATVSDLNLDGYKDIYISNDFISPDYFFFNNGDGTFTDRTGDVTGQTSFFGMGADIADYNNDGLPDIMQIDMAPEDNKRAKENMSSMRVEDFEEMLNEGLHHQYRYSTLFLNRDVVRNGLPFFSNAAWIAGVTSTDWSWAALFADLDLDGWKDLYVTNGSRRDINNIDYFKKMQETVYFDDGLDESEFLDQVRNMPYKPLTNYSYRNNGDLTFTRSNEQWGMTETSYSNGVACADLDNDGDLELIVNNIDEEAFIYRNNAREKNSGNYLKVDFEGISANKMGIGSIVNIWHNGKMQMAELTLSRGYESSVEPILYFGLADCEIIDSLRVTWSDGKVQMLKNVEINQKLSLKYSEAGSPVQRMDIEEKIFVEITDNAGFGFIHKENEYNDLKKQVLLPHRMSRLGPDISAGDVNNDQLDDFFIGNASRSSGSMFIQGKDMNFKVQEGPWADDNLSEDAGSLLFDADQDGDLDLYVVSGGNEFPEGSENYMDRLYINNGEGIFSKSENAIPAMTSSGSCVRSIDFDNDGDLDLFVGGRHVPGKYPFPAKSCILENKSGDGIIKFEDVTSDAAPSLLEAGMVTSAICADVNNDQWTDIMVAGEWMPICYYKNIEGRFEKIAIDGTRGWWFSIEGADFDKDGDIDLVAGNLGLNFRYRAGNDKTFDVYADDFDKDGNSDIVLSYIQGKKQFPLRGRECFVDQNPAIDIKFPSHKAFGEATVSDIYTKKALRESLHLQAEVFASCYLENVGNGKFEIRKFPNEAQLSSINEIIIEDFNNDGNLDILAAGNIFSVEIVTPRNDGGVGVFMKGKGNGDFELIPARESGFFAPNDVKAMSLINFNNKNKEGLVLVGNNDGKLQVFMHKQ